MIRFLLSLLVVFLLLVALQDSPPVARFLGNFPPAVPAFLHATRARMLGQPPAHAGPGPAAAEFGRFVHDVEGHAREVWHDLGKRPQPAPETPSH